MNTHLITSECQPFQTLSSKGKVLICSCGYTDLKPETTISNFIGQSSSILEFQTPNGYTRVKIMIPGSDSVIIINHPGTNDPMVTLMNDGTIVKGENYNPNEAAKEFWNAMAEVLLARGFGM